MKEEFPKVKSISEGIEKLFPFLTESQRKELERGLKAALIKEIGRIWGEREISEDRMREEIRKELEEKVGKMKSIPEDEKRRIIDRLSRFIPAEELVILKGKIKQSALKRYKLGEILVNSFLEMLKRNLGIEDKEGEEGEKKEGKSWGMLEDMKEELEKIEGKLEVIKSKLLDHIRSETEEEGMKREEKELEKISEELDEIIKRIEEKKVVDEGTLKEIKREFEEIKRKIEGVEEVKRPEEVEEELDEVLGEIEFKCMEILENEIKKLDPYKEKSEEIEKLIKEIEDKIKEKIKEKEKEEEIRRKLERIREKLGEIRDRIKRNLSLTGILEKYRVIDELERLCEELKISVDLSAEIEEGLEDIVVKNMNRMVRKDLSLYISWRVGNPLREFYYKIKRGEEI